MHPRQQRWFVALWAALAIAALLSLPYHVPMAPVFADSYLFGFNNRVGLAIVFVFGLGIAAFARGFQIPAGPATAIKPLQRSTLCWALAITFAVSGTIYLLTRRLGGVDESVYLIDRVRLALEGRVPGRDFEWPYGVAFLYPPVWLARTLHLPVGDAYGLFWIAVSLAGVALLYQTLRWVDAPDLPTRHAFLLVVAAGVVALLCTGVNYSLLRFVTPCYLAVAVWRALQRSHSGAILLVAFGSGVMLLVSPELAISFALGMGLYVVWFADLRALQNAFALAISAAALALEAWAAAKLGVFQTMQAFSSGGFNFPILPSAHILLFLLAVALCAAYAARTLQAKQPTALLALIAASVAAVAGALGRCDAGHVLLNPMGITLAALLLGGTTSAWGKAYFRLAALVFVLLPALLTMPKLVSQGRHARGVQLMPKSLDVDAMFGAPAGTVFNIPMGFTTSYFGTVHSPSLDEGYYFGFENVLVPAAVTRKIAELDTHPERPVLLPEGWQSQCRMDPDLHRRLIDVLFLYPYRAAVRHPESIDQPFCEYVAAHYRQQSAATPGRYNYQVWARP